MTDNPTRISAPAEREVVCALNDLARVQQCSREAVIKRALREYVARKGYDLAAM
jgi:predicted transcriptional regulator